MVDVFREWIIDHYWDRMPCACITGDLTDKERQVFVRAAAAYFYGCQHYKTLHLQSENPENWDIEHGVAGGQFIREINEIAPVKKRGRGPAKKYGTRLFVAVLAIEYERMTGRRAEPPALETHDHSTTKSRQFDQLCEKWAHLIDPNLPSPILSRTGYRKILDRT